LFSRRIYQASGIEARDSSIHGRGIFAAQRFEKGQMIETAPLIFLTAQEREWLQTTSLFQYYFLVGDAATPAAIGLGLSSLYNHNCPANAVYRVFPKRAVIVVTAYEAIRPGEEITLNYNGEPEDPAPVYFPPTTDL
jgi:SET domain-containing protein